MPKTPTERTTNPANLLLLPRAKLAKNPANATRINKLFLCAASTNEFIVSILALTMLLKIITIPVKSKTLA